MNPEYYTYIWYVLAVVFTALEFVKAPGVGFIFAGIGALVTGLLRQLGFIETEIAQFTCFFAVTVVSGVVLWKPMKKFRSSHAGYNDVVGATAIADSDITKLQEGKVKWSGTIMNAKLAPHAKSEVKSGDNIEIVGVEGTTLIVKPK